MSTVKQRPRTPKKVGVQEEVSLSLYAVVGGQTPVRVKPTSGPPLIALWSGRDSAFKHPPRCGTKVRSLLQINAKRGIVVGYFVEHTYLGVRVLMEDGKTEVRMFGNEVR
jgi:hypothetical protein